MSRKNHATSQQQLQVGDQTILYTLTLTDRKSVGITIRRDLSVDVRAPKGISQEAVSDIIRQRAPWILRTLAKFAKSPAQQLAPNLPKGTTYPLLGRHLTLKVKPLTESTGKAERVELAKDGVYVWIKDSKDQKRVDMLLEKWSREQAETLFFRRMVNLFARFKGYPLQIPNLELRRMKARWGSCSANGTITLNVKLIHFDEALIDYVIMHELCHLIEHNHSKNYYALLARMMPDWAARRQQLNALGMPD